MKKAELINKWQEKAKWCFESIKMNEDISEYKIELAAKIDVYNDVILDIKELEEPESEQEKVVVPQFVAEIIEKYKENDDSLGELLASVEHANIKYYHNMEKYRVDFDNLYETVVDLCAIIARAWLDGFLIDGNE